MGFFDLFKKKQDNAPAAQQPAEQAAEQKREREELAEGLQKTKSGLFSKLARAVAGRSTVDVEVLDNLEEVLITSDVGVETTVKIIRSIEERIARDKYMNTSELNAILRDEIASLLEQSHTSTEDFGIEVKEGYTNKEIAGRLYLSEGTVRNYISSILRKLELRDRTQLAIWAVQNQNSQPEAGV